MNIKKLAERLGQGMLAMTGSADAFCTVTGDFNLALGTNSCDGWRCFINLEHLPKVGIAQDTDGMLRVEHRNGVIVIIDYESGCEWHVPIK
jgi:hypothetical protein